MNKVLEILKKYKKIKEKELSNSKIKDRQNKLDKKENNENGKFPIINKNEYINLKKNSNKNIFVITSLMIPIFYIFNFFNSYIKNM